MATVVVTLKIMPASPESNLDDMLKYAQDKVTAFGGAVAKTFTEPVAFGIKAVVILFSMPEEKGSTESLEKDLSSIPNVNSVQVTDVRRTVG